MVVERHKRMQHKPVSRRDAVLFSAFAPLFLACKSNDSRGAPVASAGQPYNAPAPTSPSSASASDPNAKDAAAAPRACGETEASIEGPYYRANAPERADLTDAGMSGVPLEIEGRVTTIDCKTPLVDVELDFWQANHTGHYDNDGTLPRDHLLLRGRLKTDGDGRYRVKTIVPGRYLNGKQYRPAHVHVKLRAKAHGPITTQLYFPDDPFNDIDPFLHRSLIMDVKRKDRILVARYDFVLRPA